MRLYHVELSRKEIKWLMLYIVCMLKIICKQIQKVKIVLML